MKAKKGKWNKETTHSLHFYNGNDNEGTKDKVIMK